MTTLQGSKWIPVTTISELQVGDIVRSSTMTNSQKYIGTPGYEAYNRSIEGIIVKVPEELTTDNHNCWDPVVDFVFEDVKIMVSGTMDIERLVAIPGISGNYTIEKKVAVNTRSDVE